MEQIKLISIILLALFTGSCSINPKSNKNKNYIKMSDEITLKTINEINKQDDLKLIGSGGSMMENVKTISLHFYYYHSTSIDEARLLLIKIINQLIFAFNSDEKIRPYLANYPFNEKNLDISITFTTKNNEYQPLPSISLASAENSNMNYYNYSSEKDRLISILEEPYREALKKAALTN